MQMGGERPGLQTQPVRWISDDTAVFFEAAVVE